MISHMPTMTAKPLDDFSLQTLQALFVYQVENPDLWKSITDDDIWDTGQELFGQGWGGTKTQSKTHGYDYAPSVAMRLGILAKGGCVDKQVIVEEGYSTWLVSAIGRQTLLEYGFIDEYGDIIENV